MATAGGVLAWSEEDVATWVAEVTGREDRRWREAAAVPQRFRDQEIDGRALVSYALPRDRNELKNDFGLSIGQATALWEAVCDLARDCGAPAAEEGVPQATERALQSQVEALTIAVEKLQGRLAAVELIVSERAPTVPLTQVRPAPCYPVSGFEDAVVVTELLQRGDEPALNALSLACEIAMDGLDQAIASASRKDRRRLQRLLDNFDKMDDIIDLPWCACLRECTADNLMELCGAMVEVQAAAEAASSGDGLFIERVAESMCNQLAFCGNGLLRSSAVLRNTTVDKQSTLRALTTIQLMPTDVQPAEAPSRVDEHAALLLVAALFGGDNTDTSIRVEACYAAITLSARNGISFAGDDALSEVDAMFPPAYAALHESESISDVELCVAVGAVYLMRLDVAAKEDLDRRKKIEASVTKSAMIYMGVIVNYPSEIAIRISTQMVGVVIETAEKYISSSRVVGVTYALNNIITVRQHDVLKTIWELELYPVSWRLYEASVPTLAPAQWWSEHNSVVNLPTASATSLARILESPTVIDTLNASAEYWTLPADSQLKHQSWWQSWVHEAIHMVHVNAAAHLSAQNKLTHMVFQHSLCTITHLAKDESQHTFLLDLGITEPLLYASANNFVMWGTSIASEASIAAVHLMGRNEESGFRLTRAAVLMVVERHVEYWREDETWKSQAPLDKLLRNVSVLKTMSMSDANKRYMLEHDELIDSLISGLLQESTINNKVQRRRATQPGADHMRETCASVLQDLALTSRGSEMLRENARALAALRDLVQHGTPLLQQCARVVLFEVGGRVSTRSGDSAEDVKQKHLMISYNWKHQDVVIRVMEALRARGYNVWVDVERMKGATVRIMLLCNTVSFSIFK